MRKIILLLPLNRGIANAVKRDTSTILDSILSNNVIQDTEMFL